MTKECEVCEGLGYEDNICLSCSGSGEGCACGTTCRSCHGSGSEKVECENCNGTGEVFCEDDD